MQSRVEQSRVEYMEGCVCVVVVVVVVAAAAVVGDAGAVHK